MEDPLLDGKNENTWCSTWFTTTTTTVDPYIIPNTLDDLKRRIKDLAVLINQQDSRIAESQREGLRYLNEEGDNERAELECEMMLKEQDIRTLYLRVWQKLRMIHSEIEKVTTLSSCTDILQKSSRGLEKILNSNVNLKHITGIMESLDKQVSTISSIEHRVTSEELRKTLETKLPELGKCMLDEIETRETIILN